MFYKIKINIKFIIIQLLLLSSFSIILADDLHFVNDLVGDRAIGFGGAFTAIADDPSGAYYNPAGLAFAYDNQISLSVNTFKSEQRVYAKTINGKPYTRNLQSFYPSFFGVVNTLGKWKIAFTFLSINREELDQDDSFTEINTVLSDSDTFAVVLKEFHINLNINDTTTLYGASLARTIGDSLALGATLYGLARHNETTTNQTLIFEGQNVVDNAIVSQAGIRTYEIQNKYVTDDYSGGMIKLGVQYMPVDIISIGSSVTMGVITSHTRATQQFIKKRNAGIDFDDSVFTKSKSDITDDKIPLNVRSGIAYIASKNLIISGDVIADIGDRNYSQLVNSMTLNYAAGIEYYLTNSLPVRFGAFTNFANVPTLSTTNQLDNLANEKVDLLGIASSVSWQSRNSSITLGGFYQFGTGEQQIIQGNLDKQDLDVEMIAISLTGTASY